MDDPLDAHHQAIPSYINNAASISALHILKMTTALVKELAHFAKKVVYI
ncbi:unnamed protein product [Wuchereria bancrofti]|uniref:Uncharacterized protein n=1 Tax=Wuchereria bancrofti TaxID=6293 RepID=A0A3P7EFH7_WUCBA|nr:unnamed protein product [Wuchereria bancrofti]